MSPYPIINFIIFLSSFDCQKSSVITRGQLGYLETCYVKPYNTKVVYNGVLHNLINVGNFWRCGLKSREKRRVNVVVMNGSLNVRCLNIGFGCAQVRICYCIGLHDCVCTENCSW